MLPTPKPLDESTLPQHFQQVRSCIKCKYGQKSGYGGVTPPYHTMLILHTGVNYYVKFVYLISKNAKAPRFDYFQYHGINPVTEEYRRVFFEYTYSQFKINSEHILFTIRCVMSVRYITIYLS